MDDLSASIYSLLIHKSLIISVFYFLMLVYNSPGSVVWARGGD